MSNILLMGVSGSGKTKIGALLAEQLGYRMVDGDDYHSDSSIAQMKAGTPLTDQQRLPWLQQLASLLKKERQLVLTCSALKQQYRNLLLRECSDCNLIWLHTTPCILRQRLQQRCDHFFPPHLLDSQLEALEPPKEAAKIDSNQSPPQIVSTILKKLYSNNFLEE